MSLLFCRNQKDVLINGIGVMLGNKPNLTVTIELMKAVTDSQSEVMITILEKGATGSSRKIPASDLCAFFNQPTQKQQLANAGVISIAAYMTPTKAQLEDYLKNPPPGMNIVPLSVSRFLLGALTVPLAIKNVL